MLDLLIYLLNAPLHSLAAAQHAQDSGRWPASLCQGEGLASQGITVYARTLSFIEHKGPSETVCSPEVTFKKQLILTPESVFKTVNSRVQDIYDELATNLYVGGGGLSFNFLLDEWKVHSHAINNSLIPTTRGWEGEVCVQVLYLQYLKASS